MRQRLSLILTVVLALLPALCRAARTDATVFNTPADIWRGIDVEAPLDVEVKQAWEENGAAFQKLYFTSETAGGKPVRVFAIQGAPVGGKRLAGILHIHGGGQTASLEWVRFWTRRGYVCVTFDFCGPFGARQSDVTDWGSIRHANMAEASGGFQVRPTPRESAWYHWALASRRALTLLARHPAVDPKRLGIYGISVGGTLTWVVAGSDKRVRAAVPIYGCGYNVDERKAAWGLGKPSEDQLVYKRTLSPEAHAPRVRCPLLFLSSTNDHHGWIDDGYAALSLARGPVRQAFTPHYIHHVEAEQGADLPLWMDWHLRGGKAWPKSPPLTLALDARGEVAATVSPDRARGVRSVVIYYTLGEHLPQARFWRRVEPRRTGDRWTAPLPVMNARESLRAIANVTYDTGVCLTSNLAHALPGDLGAARATLAWTGVLDDCAQGYEGWYYLSGYTDPSITLTYLRRVEGPHGQPGFSGDLNTFGDPVSVNFATHRPGDPQLRGRDGMSLAFACKGAFDKDGLTVTMIERDWQPTNRVYTAHLAPEALGREWSTVTLSLDRFTAADGKHPAHWADLDALQLKGSASRKDPPCFADFRWVPGG